MNDYIKKEDRKKILLLSEDMRLKSGIATMSREIIVGTAHHYNWVQIGAAINHPDKGKILDLSDDINQIRGIDDADVRIIANDGYGDCQLVRGVIASERPDAVFIFTDPRYWTWLFEMEREIRSKIPLVYLNIWDNLPYPMYNKPYYESCDALLAISKQTKNINEQVLGPELAAERIIRYIPHGVSSKFKPIAADDQAFIDFKKSIWKENEPGFKLLYNARNIGRKKCGTLIMGWREFCDNLKKEEAQNCELVMHTDIVDNAGTDLKAIVDSFCDPDHCKVRFIEEKWPTETLNLLYNACDGVILPSTNEGWGLSLTEALNVGKMIIATVTGGMQDQMRITLKGSDRWIDFTREYPSHHRMVYDFDRYEWGKWAIPLFPEQTLCGSVPTPYIWDDNVTPTDISLGILNLYSMSREEREQRGALGREWATGDEAGFTSAKMAERIIEGLEATFENFKPRSEFDLVKVEDRPSGYVKDFDPNNYRYDGC